MKVIKKDEIPSGLVDRYTSRYHHIYDKIRTLEVGECLIVDEYKTSENLRNIAAAIRSNMNSHWSKKQKGWPKVRVMTQEGNIYCLVIEKEKQRE